MKNLYHSSIIRTILLFLSLLFYIPNESAADESIDDKINELYQRLYSARTDSAKVNAILEICDSYRYKKPDSVFILAKEAYEISKTIKYKQIQTAKVLGVAYMIGGDYLRSAKYLFEAFNLAQAAEDKHEMCSILGEIQLNCNNTYDYEKALEYSIKAYNLSYDYSSRFKTTFDLGQAYLYLENGPKAIEYLQEALKLAEAENNSQDIAKAYNRFGVLYFFMQDNDKSLDYFRKSMETNPPDNISLTINNMSAIARVYIDARRFYEGIKINLQVDSITGAKHLAHAQMLACKTLSVLYDSTGQTKMAYKYCKKYFGLKDSIYQKEKMQQLNFLNTEFETTQKELQIATLEREAKLTRTLNIVYIIIACLVLLMLFFVIKSHRQKIRILVFEKKSLEYEKTKEALEKEQLKTKLFEKDREMLTKILQINQQKEALSNMMQEANKILKKDSLKEIYNSVKRLNSNISAKINLCDDWNQIKLHFDKVHPEFFENLKSSSADLTPIDMKLCAYTKLKFSVKEISRLLNVDHRSVIMARYRLKKKFNISAEVSFDNFIENR